MRQRSVAANKLINDSMEDSWMWSPPQRMPDRPALRRSAHTDADSIVSPLCPFPADRTINIAHLAPDVP